jgi:hypothetical protein
MGTLVPKEPQILVASSGETMHSMELDDVHVRKV